MNATELLLFVYRLSLPTVVVLALLVSVGITYLHRRFCGKMWWKLFLGIAVVLSVCGIVYITILRREPGTVHVMNLVPLHSYRLWLSGQQIEALRSNLMNMILFVPFGLLFFAVLPERWPVWKKLRLAIVCGCLLSIGVEWIQFIRQCGEVETDDVINNTIGTLFGGSGIPLEWMIWEKCTLLGHKSDR